jgi:hypothetical protein
MKTECDYNPKKFFSNLESCLKHPFPANEDKKACLNGLSYERKNICLRGQRRNVNNVASHLCEVVELSRFSVNEKPE